VNIGLSREPRLSTTHHRTALTTQCAGLVLAYSRRLLVKDYPGFTRFEAKHFLLEAARFMDLVRSA
jgi:hypothetical protein